MFRSSGLVGAAACAALGAALAATPAHAVEDRWEHTETHVSFVSQGQEETISESRTLHNGVEIEGEAEPESGAEDLLLTFGMVFDRANVEEHGETLEGILGLQVESTGAEEAEAEDAGVQEIDLQELEDIAAEDVG